MEFAEFVSYFNMHQWLKFGWNHSRGYSVMRF